ncbi:lipase family alpha/beta hydrolase [Nocardioides sp.]|uniref:lipase family alpha/beta hydrolase n=1 Tax=Nocardioides sp. TaxID=35761 RepID=UPI0035279B88
MASSGADSVDVVGYSAGGVVARWWVRFDDGAPVARRVVTISSPHHGTQVALLAAGLAPDACPVGCQQLAPDSDLLRRLNAGDETPAGPTWVSLWSADDQTVTPPDSAVLDGALDIRMQDICPDLTLSHGQMPQAGAVVGSSSPPSTTPRCRHRPAPCAARAEPRPSGQSVMSLVTKLAQAAPRNTTR